MSQGHAFLLHGPPSRNERRFAFHTDIQLNKVQIQVRDELRLYQMRATKDQGIPKWKRIVDAASFEGSGFSQYFTADSTNEIAVTEVKRSSNNVDYPRGYDGYAGK